MNRVRRKAVLADGATVSIIALFIISALLPFCWMMVTSLKTKSELFSLQFPLWVHRPTWENYIDLLALTPFADWFANSAVVSTAATVIALVFGSLAAYGLSRMPSELSILTVQATLLTYLIPRAVFVVPLYSLLNSLHLLDSLVGLTLAYLSFTLPFTIWLLIGFFQSIPKDLDEAALIDGCSRIGAMVRIVLPLAAPGLVATGIYSFSTAWNEFMYPLALMQTQTRTTVTVGIASLRQADVFAWGQIMAAGTLGAIPIMVFYAFIYKRIVGGLVAGSVKG
jgi:ABC-type glycerol-3-phosphate transport system permease component